jgi:hypothetical protein
MSIRPLCCSGSFPLFGESSPLENWFQIVCLYGPAARPAGWPGAAGEMARYYLGSNCPTLAPGRPPSQTWSSSWWSWRPPSPGPTPRWPSPPAGSSSPRSPRCTLQCNAVQCAAGGGQLIAGPGGGGRRWAAGRWPSWRGRSRRGAARPQGAQLPRYAVVRQVEQGAGEAAKGRHLGPEAPAWGERDHVN